MQLIEKLQALSYQKFYVLFFFAPHSIDKPINDIYYINQNTIKHEH